MNENTVITCRAGHKHEWYQPNLSAPPDCPSCYVRPLLSRNFRIRAESELGIPITLTDTVSLSDHSCQSVFLYNHPSRGEITIILIRSHLPFPEISGNTIVIGTVSDRGNIQTPAAMCRDLVAGLEKMGVKRNGKPIFERTPLPDLFSWAAPPSNNTIPINIPIIDRVSPSDNKIPANIPIIDKVPPSDKVPISINKAPANIPPTPAKRIDTVVAPSIIDYVKEWEKEIDMMRAPIQNPIPANIPPVDIPPVNTIVENLTPVIRQIPATYHHKAKKHGNLSLGFFSEYAGVKRR